MPRPIVAIRKGSEMSSSIGRRNAFSRLIVAATSSSVGAFPQEMPSSAQAANITAAESTSQSRTQAEIFCLSICIIFVFAEAMPTPKTRGNGQLRRTTREPKRSRRNSARLKKSGGSGARRSSGAPVIGCAMRRRSA